MKINISLSSKEHVRVTLSIDYRRFGVEYAKTRLQTLESTVGVTMSNSQY